MLVNFVSDLMQLNGFTDSLAKGKRDPITTAPKSGPAHIPSKLREACITPPRTEETKAKPIQSPPYRNVKPVIKA